VIYPSRNMEREPHHQFGDILALNRVQRIYLDSLGETATTSLGVGVVKLVIEPENHAVNLAKSLITQAKEEINEPTIQQELIDLIETIIIYKLPQKTRKEIETMLGLSELKKTKVYQEALAEGEEIGEERGEQKAKLDAIPRMIGFGLKLEDIANLLNLPLEVVQQVAQPHNNDN
jgi:predicted transposase/invertase (TIGR01784 family)